MKESLLPASEVNFPKLYDVDKSHKSESYIFAIRGNKSPTDSSPNNNQPITNIGPPLNRATDQQPLKAPVNDHIPLAIKEQGNGLPLPITSPLLEDWGRSGEKIDKGEIGFTIEELERYRRDPFWRALRWVMFAFFWLFWIIMFLSATVIVVFSPRCAQKVSHHWWRNTVSYQVWTPSFQDSDGNGLGDLPGLISRLENLRRIGIQAVWPEPFLLSDGFSNAIRDHLAVDSKLGLNEDAVKLIGAVHSKGMKILISIPVSITSKEHDWFYRSARASLPEYSAYTDYYHWRKNENNEKNSSFMSEYSNTSIRYLHYESHPGRPVLNWQSASVRQNMFDVFSHWIDKDIDGFYLDGIDYLARVPDGSVPNWSAVKDILRDIRDHVDSYAKESSVANGKSIVLFASHDNAVEDDKKSLVASGLNSVINYELGNVALNSKICHSVENSIAGCVHEILSDLLLFHTTADVPAMWEFGNPSLSRIASRLRSEIQVELLTMVQLLLQGTNNVYYGDEIGMTNLPNNATTPVQRGAMQWDDTKNAGFSASDSPMVDVHSNYKEHNWAGEYKKTRSHLRTFQKLARLRKTDETLSIGETFIGQLVNSAFIVVRYKKTNTSEDFYICAVNFGASATTLPLDDLSVVDGKKMNKAIVIISSSNADQYSPRETVDLSGMSITLPAENGIVFKVSG